MKEADSILELIDAYAVRFKKPATRIYLGGRQRAVLRESEVAAIAKHVEVIWVSAEDHVFVTSVEQEVI